MGMFDDINFKCECPYCSKTITGFQSKDGPCAMLDLEPWMVKRFYAHCNSCHKWVEYAKIPQYGDETYDYGVDLLKDGYTAYTLLKLIDKDVESLPIELKTLVKDFLNKSSFPKDDSWIKDYVLLPQKDNKDDE